MAKNFVKEGNTITCVAPAGGVIAGVLILIGSLPVVPSITAAEGVEFEGHTVGVWEFKNKTLANTPTFGAKAYLNAAGTEITTTASGNNLIGAFLSSGGNGSGVCTVRLNGVTV